MLLVRISMTLFCHSSLSSIVPGRSFRLHPSVQSCYRKVLASHPTLAGPCEKEHKSPAYLARRIWIVFEMDGRWPHCWIFVGSCLQDLFKTSRSILVEFSSSFLPIRLVSIHVLSSCINCPSLMSSWLPIIYVIGSSVTLGCFQSRFWKCSFHK